MKLSGIYLIINVVNDKMYVGSATHILQRWSWHIRHLNLGDHHNKHLQRSWDKHGSEAFQFVIVEECKIEDLETIEQIWIDTKCFAYNIYLSAGSPRGRKLTEEHKLKISISGKGRVTSDEAKALISKYQLNRSAEHKANHAAAMKKRGITPEHAQKLKEANMKRGYKFND